VKINTIEFDFKSHEPFQKYQKTIAHPIQSERLVMMGKIGGNSEGAFAIKKKIHDFTFHNYF
jgi:hypothetical protein